MHELAGSTKVLHLHGDLLKARNIIDADKIFDWKGDMKIGDFDENSIQIRPHIVWFGEAVPKMDEAIPLVQHADIFFVIGTSLVVYPAAGLINYTKYEAPKWLIDPNDLTLPRIPNLEFINEKATTGVDLLVKQLLSEA